MKLLAASLLAATAADDFTLSAAVKNVRANLDGGRIIRIPLPTENEAVGSDPATLIGQMMEAIDGDEWGKTDEGIDVMVPKSAMGALRAVGFKYEDKTEDWMNQFEKNFEDENFVCTKNAQACAKSNDFYRSYQRLGAIHSRIDDLAIANPDIATIGSMGKSFEGRDQKTIAISKDSSLPTVLYFCAEHAREWLTPMYCTHMAEELLRDDQGLLDKVQFMILPVFNPDGYEYSHTNNNMWRKSRKPNAGNSCIGTDLNRNYGTQHCGTGASSNPCSDTYCGTAAFDNVETENIKKWAEGMKAAGKQILIETDVHAYGMMWMNPWGYTKALAPDFAQAKQCGDATADAIRKSSGLNFATGSIANVIYEAAGSSCDWFYDAIDVIYAYAPEVRGRSFQPSASEIIPSNEEIFAGMVAQVECALGHQKAKNLPVKGGQWCVSAPAEGDVTLLAGADFRGSFRDFSLWVEESDAVVPGCSVLEKHSRSNNAQLWVVEFDDLAHLKAERRRAEKHGIKVVLERGHSLLLDGDVPGTMGYDACGSEQDKTVISVSSHPIRGAHKMSRAEKDKYMARASTPDDKNVNLLSLVSQSSLEGMITHMQEYQSRNSYSGDNGLAADWAEAELRKYGFTVTRDSFREDMTPQVVAELKGTTAPEQIVVVGAHYDSRGSSNSDPRQRAPGADDNGSGSAAIIEFARIIHASQTTFEHTLRLCLFTGEEQGLVGSRALARKWAADNADIIAMFNADMIGYKVPGSAPTIALMNRNADVDLNEIAKTSTSTYLGNKLAVGYTQACCSDQQAFFENGFPAAGFFETPTERVVYPQYHKSDDLLEFLDMEQITLQATATMASAIVFAGVTASNPHPPAPKHAPHDIFPHIIGGTEVSPPGKYSFLVALNRKGFSAFNGQFCGGSLISATEVLTAAHCCEGFQASQVEVLLGWHDLANDNEGSRLSVDSISVYSGYDPRTLDADVCTLKLASPAPRSAAPIALDTGLLNKNNRYMKVAGWGNTASSGPGNFPSKAQEVDVPYVPNSVCNVAPSQNAGEISDQMLCAGYASGGKDACQGDSGGPLFFDAGNGQLVLSGVVSWGYGCAQPNAYGVYARVSEFLPFIQNGRGARTPSARRVKVPPRVALAPKSDASFAHKSELPHAVFPHIIGGTEVSPPGKYSFLVALNRKGFSAFNGQFCGGSLISATEVLTAAHCCAGFQASQVEVLLGWHDLANDNEGSRLSVDSISMHPQYSSATLDADICTLTLAAPVSRRSATPIALDRGLSKSAGQTMTVAGWGNTATAGADFPSKAQEVDVPYVPNSACNSFPSMYVGQITDGMLCAGFEDGGKDACQGDSGGPLFATINGVPTLTGVVSWGYGCAQPNAAGVYARVSFFLPFIDGVAHQLALQSKMKVGATPNFSGRTDEHGHRSSGAPIGGIVGAIAGVGALAAVAFVVLKKRAPPQALEQEPITPYGLSTTHDHLASL